MGRAPDTFRDGGFSWLPRRDFFPCIPVVFWPKLVTNISFRPSGNCANVGGDKGQNASVTSELGQTYMHSYVTAFLLGVRLHMRAFSPQCHFFSPRCMQRSRLHHIHCFFFLFVFLLICASEQAAAPQQQPEQQQRQHRGPFQRQHRLV